MRQTPPAARTSRTPQCHTACYILHAATQSARSMPHAAYAAVPHPAHVACCRFVGLLPATVRSAIDQRLGATHALLHSSANSCSVLAEQAKMRLTALELPQALDACVVSDKKLPERLVGSLTAAKQLASGSIPLESLQELLRGCKGAENEAQTFAIMVRPPTGLPTAAHTSAPTDHRPPRPIDQLIARYSLRRLTLHYLILAAQCSLLHTRAWTLAHPHSLLSAHHPPQPFSVTHPSSTRPEFTCGYLPHYTLLGPSVPLSPPRAGSRASRCRAG